MLTTELKVETIGEPNLQALCESERHSLIQALFASILECIKAN